jgi:hypothetical protein
LKMIIYANGLYRIVKREEGTLTLRSLRDSSLEINCDENSALLEEPAPEMVNYYMSKYANANGYTKQARAS